MKFNEKNDGGIELHLSLEERELLHDALRHYSAYGKERDVLERMEKICEILNVLHLREFDRRGLD